MNRYVAFVVLCVAALASADDEWQGRIIGGMNAASGQFPYQVSLKTTAGVHFCGGAIIGDRWLLTAGHCVIDGKPSEMVAVVGMLSNTRGGYNYDIERFVVHPNYNDWTQENDVALVRTWYTLHFNTVVFPVKMARSYAAANRAVLASGWGLTTLSSSKPADVLQYVALRTISNDECSRRLQNIKNRVLTGSNVCTFSRTTQGTCMGDSGGPLVEDGELVGIVSWGIPCAVGYPDVYVRVASFRAWISAISGVY